MRESRLFEGGQIGILLLILMVAPVAVSAQRPPNTDSPSIQGVASTIEQTAVFAAFLSNLAGSEQFPSGIDTAISVSNVLTPAGFQSELIGSGDPEDSGTIEFHLWNRDGSTIFWDTGSNPDVGIGLNPDGTLGPGQTFTVLLADILEAAGGNRDDSFNGFAWIIGNFDAMAGTYNVTVFDVGFTQSFELTPAVGQGNTSTAGIPVVRQESGQ